MCVLGHPESNTVFSGSNDFTILQWNSDPSLLDSRHSLSRQNSNNLNNSSSNSSNSSTPALFKKLFSGHSNRVRCLLAVLVSDPFSRENNSRFLRNSSTHPLGLITSPQSSPERNKRREGMDVKNVNSEKKGVSSRRGEREVLWSGGDDCDIRFNSHNPLITI